MKNLMSYLWMAVCFTLLMPIIAFAQDVVGPIPDVVAAVEPDIGTIFSQIMKAIGDWKALGWQAGMAGLLTVTLSTMKNSLLRAWLWDKVPEWMKVLVAPLISIMIFALAMGTAFDAKAFIAAITTGVAAVYLHQFFDGLKNAPFVKDWMKPILDFIAKLLKKPEKTPEQKALEEAKQKVLEAK